MVHAFEDAAVRLWSCNKRYMVLIKKVRFSLAQGPFSLLPYFVCYLHGLALTSLMMMMMIRKRRRKRMRRKRMMGRMRKKKWRMKRNKVLIMLARFSHSPQDFFIPF